MKKIITRIFVFFGVLFCIEVIGILYLVVADPFNLRPLARMLLQQQTNAPVVSETTPAAEPPGVTSFQADYEVKTSKDNGSTTPGVFTEPSAPSIPAPTPEQAKALESVGLSVSALSKVSPAQKICFENILGAARVGEITRGAVPTMAEFLSVRDCFSNSAKSMSRGFCTLW